MSDTKPTMASTVGSLASCFSKVQGASKGWSFLSPGDVAELRRMDVAIPAAAAWRLLESFVPADMRSSIESERRWTLVFQGMAFMSPTVHDPNVSFGQALADTGYAADSRPIRMNRLLAAQDETFDDLLLKACRFLKSKAQPADWAGIARLFIYRNDAARRELAKAFFTTSSRTATNKSAA